MPNPWDNDPIVGQSVAPSVTPLPPSPKEVRQQGRDDASDRRDEIRTGIAVRGENRQEQNTQLDNLRQMSQAYNQDPTVKAYRVAVTQLAQALGTGKGAQADLALTYAFAKAMDPDSVVRESEQNMVTGSQPWFQAAVEQTKKQFGMDGAGNYTPKARAALRAQIINAVKQRDLLYNQRRGYFADLASKNGLDPDQVIGRHDAAPFVPQFQQYDRQQAEGHVAEMVKAGAKPEEIRAYLDRMHVDPSTVQNIDEAAAFREQHPEYKGEYPVHLGDYQGSYVGQTVSGLNEGIADTLGGPVDLMTGAMNLIPRGINAVADTNIPTIQKPFLGSQFFKDAMANWAVYPQTDDPSKQFVRRVGESVGSAIVPAGAAGSLPRAGAALASGLGGGIGAATARQVAPNSPLAEMGGELLGGGMFGAGLVKGAQRTAQRAIESRIPTVDQLKQQAGDLYRSAEARGVVADPAQTQTLAEAMRDSLRQSGRISPTGRISEVYPKAKEAIQLADDYSGQPMNPTQMQTVRDVVTDGLMSKDANERRIARNLTDTFDEWANPLAPELPQARDISSRYLAAQQLERARELAAARAGQFTGSGFENALRTEYRGLDRGTITGSNRFSNDVSNAIEDVSRGTPGSNFARAAGRFAPTGPVSFGLGSGVPAAVGFGIGGAPGAAIGGSFGLAGIAGRAAATKMGIRNADIAELTARNGGAIPIAPLTTPDIDRLIAAMSVSEMAKYLSAAGVIPNAADQQQVGGNPQPLAGGKGKKPRSRGLFGMR